MFWPMAILILFQHRSQQKKAALADDAASSQPSGEARLVLANCLTVHSSVEENQGDYEQKNAVLEVKTNAAHFAHDSDMV